MEPVIREVEVKSVLTKSNLPVGDYSVNPYIGCTHGCKYCYASFMKRFTGHTEPWGSFLDVKLWQKIRSPQKYDGKELFFGSVTDPYLPQEAEYLRTRTLLEELRGSKIKLSIQTKSSLVLRDIELIRSFEDARVGFSINTLDEGFRQDMDNASAIEERIAAMRELHSAGIRTTCFISPIFPGITDVPAIIKRVRDCCNLIWLENLNLRGDYKAAILAYIREKYPSLVPLYDSIYRLGDMSYWESLDRLIAELAKSEGLTYLKNDDSIAPPLDAPPVIVNYFYHEKIKKSAVRDGRTE